jgi:hypothetical protein
MLKAPAMLLLLGMLLVTFQVPALAQDAQLACEAEPTDMQIAPGEIINCSISPVTDTDIYRFEATAGHWLMLTLTDRTGGSPTLRGELYGPSGTPLDTLGRQDVGDHLIWEVAESGTYTFLIREAGDNHTASYNLALQRIFPPADEVEDLCIDCEILASIDVVADSDLIRFSAEPGATLVLTLTDRTGGSPLTMATLYDPDRQIIATLGEQDAGVEYVIQPAQGDYYTLLMAESGDNHTASYAISLQQLFPRPDSFACINYGEIVSAFISPVTDSDVFVFGGVAGSEIILTLADLTGGSPIPVAEVYDPTGQHVHTLSSQDGSDPWQVVLAETGLYTVHVKEGGFNHTVSYNLGLQCLFGDCPPCSQVPTERSSWGAMKSKYR